MKLSLRSHITAGSRFCCAAIWTRLLIAMFFSLRRNNDDDDDDSPIEKGKPLSFSGVVKKLNETRNPSPKKAVPNGTGLLSVVTTLAAIDPTAKDAHLSSDELVKKLFKGLGMPMYKPEVQAAYLNSEVPSAVQDYRWGAFDLPVYHDTMLSIVRPPTPPPVPEQTQLLLDTVPSNGADAQSPPPIPPDETEASGAILESEALSPSIRGIIESISSRGSFSSSTSKGDFILGQGSAKNMTANGQSAKQPALMDAAQNAQVAARSSKNRQSVTAEVIAAGMEAIHEEQPEEGAEVVDRSDVVSPAVDLDVPASAEAVDQSSIEDPGEDPAVDAAERGLAGLSVKAGVSAKQPRHASQKISKDVSQKGSVFSGAVAEDSDDVSVEALLQLGSIESQRQYLKPGLAPQQQQSAKQHAFAEPEPATLGEAVTEQELEQKEEQRQAGSNLPPALSPAPEPEAERPLSPRSQLASKGQSVKSPPMLIPVQPPPLSPPRPTEAEQSSLQAQQAQQAQQQQQQPKAEGKMVSPASRSVFRPTFAKPRPAPTDAETSGGDTTHVAAQANELAPSWENGVLSFSPPKAKQNHMFFSEHQNYSAQASPQHQYQQVPPQQYAGERETSTHKAQGIRDQEVREGKGRSRHSVGEEEEQEQGQVSPSHHDQHKRKKHASPGRRWYLAGAYSSHREAVDAIHKMNRAIDLHGLESGDDDGEGAEGRFRIQRDLSRMQWVIECNDLSNKALVLAHGNRGASSSNEREADKYRRIVQSVQQIQSTPALHQKDWDLSPEHHRPAGSKLQVQARREERREDRQKDKPSDKFLRERDAFHENHLRQVRQKLPKEEAEGRQRERGQAGAGAGARADGGGVRFPPIQQARDGAGAAAAVKRGGGGGEGGMGAESHPQARKGKKGKKKG